METQQVFDIKYFKIMEFKKIISCQSKTQLILYYYIIYYEPQIL